MKVRGTDDVDTSGSVVDEVATTELKVLCVGQNIETDDVDDTFWGLCRKQ